MSNELIEKINEYLNVGGFFNPELMEHHKVSDLLLECRNELLKANTEIEQLREEAEFGYITGFDVAKNQYCTMVQELEDENERQRAENEAILAANRDVMLHWDVLKADYECLRAALKEILNLPYGSEGYCRVIARAALDDQPAPGKSDPYESFGRQSGEWTGE